MKFCILAIILSLFTAVSYAASPKESAYSDSIECKAAKMAYEMVKQYFPDKRICVSDTVYIKGYDFHIREIEPKYKLDVMNYGINLSRNSYLGVNEFYSENLHKLFHDDLSQNNQGDYTIAFSVPYHRMITCGMSKYGEPYRDYFMGNNYEFLFIYDEDGKITKLSAVILRD